MIYFLDTEFIEDVNYLDPISIGIACADGREYYAVSSEFNVSRASQWVVDNVIAKLPPMAERKSRAVIARELLEFVTHDHPEFWAWYADYDWVCFMWLLGKRMIDLPDGWPMYCRDLKQSLWERGLSADILPKIDKTRAHNALEDAKWLRAAHRLVLGVEFR